MGHPSFEEVQSEPIAVIGFSFRYPRGANTDDALWKMMLESVCASSDIPEDRMNLDAFYHPDGKRNSSFNFRGGHFFKEDIRCFDAPFFSIKPAEATAMDPHQRWLLEITFKALENAGISLQDVSGSRTSVFTASFADDYRAIIHRDPDRIPTYHILGTSQSILANRLSWFFNLRGASVNIDTACSSSLVAIDQACQNLLNNDADMSIVTGGNVILDPTNLVAHANLNLLSPDSKCFSFDSRANGYSTGEGIGVLVLKRLSDAVRDQNTIRAVIRSTGTNSDGRTPGISQPSSAAQQELIKSTYRKAGLNMGLTRFVEAHATGTSIGDPIEATAIGTAFEKERSEDEPMILGAVKSNIGHLEGGSGIASIIKTILVLEHGIIPPNANFESLNPKIDAKKLKLEFPRKAREWPSSGLRRASVNSFGFGGTNCHVVIEDAWNHLHLRSLRGLHFTSILPSISKGLTQLHIPGKIVHDPSSGETNGTNGDYDHSLSANGIIGKQKSTPRLLLWSAADKDGITRLIHAHNDYFQNHQHKAQDCRYLDNLVHTLLMHRSVFDWRAFSVITDPNQLLQLDGITSSALKSEDSSDLGFVFTGQGAQWPGMGHELMAVPAFHESILRSDEYLQHLGCDWSLLDELRKVEGSKLDDAALSQPISTALQIALVDLLDSLGIYPKVVVGHSSGEIAAAFALGAISRKSALRLAYYRGLLSSTLCKSGKSKATMMSVGISATEIYPYLAKLRTSFPELELYVACINSPRNITMSGDAGQIDALSVLLKPAGIFHRKLKVEVAYHSPRMREMATQYRQLVGDLEAGDFRLEQPSMISSLTGEILRFEDLRDVQYWIDNLTWPVQFSGCIENLYEENPGMSGTLGTPRRPRLLLEIGPHSTLQGPVREILTDMKVAPLPDYLSCLQRNKDGFETFLAAVGQLYSHGFSIDRRKLSQLGSTKSPPIMIPDLPSYPFNHASAFWSDGVSDRGYRFRPFPRHDLLGIPVADFDPLEARWRHNINTTDHPWTKDHVVDEAILYPATGMIAMAIEASKLLSDKVKSIRGFKFKDIQFKSALLVPDDSKGVETMFLIRRLHDRRTRLSSWSEFVLSHYKDGKWNLNCRGRISVEYDEMSLDPDYNDQNARIYRKIFTTTRQACSFKLNTDSFYTHLKACGLYYGPTFQCLDEPYLSDNGESVSEVQLFQIPQDEKEYQSDYTVHPASLDSIFHLFYANLSGRNDKPIPAMVPTVMRKLWISNQGLKNPSPMRVHSIAKTTRVGRKMADSSVTALDFTTFEPRVIAEGIEVVAVTELPGSSVVLQHNQRYHRMIWKPDVTIMNRQQLEAFTAAIEPDDPAIKGFFDDLTLVQLMFIKAALDELQNYDSALMNPGHRKHLGWMKRSMNQFHAGTLPGARPEWRDKLEDLTLREKLSASVREFSIQGKVTAEVGPNIAAILRGERNMLEDFFTTDRASELYRYIYRTRNLDQGFTKYLDALAHKNPNMTILEIGAGTGSATRHIMDILGRAEEDGTRHARYKTYDFTDISAYFFEKARVDFSEHLDRMRFKLFDVARDPLEQGISGETYDLVVAVGSMHLTPDLALTIKNMRKVLKVGGKLVICDPIKPELLRTCFFTGMLPGWFVGTEDFRHWSPQVEEEKWNELLKAGGYSGLDVVIPDYIDKEYAEISFLVATAIESDTTLRLPDVTILIPSSSGQDKEMATVLHSSLRNLGRQQVDVMSWEDAARQPTLQDRLYISLLEYSSPILDHLDEATFESLKAFFLSVKSLLWVSGGGLPESSPLYGVAEGLLRVLRNENTSSSMILLTLEHDKDCTARHASHITNLIQTNLSPSPSDMPTVEYTERQGILHINRLKAVDHIQKAISQRIQDKETITQPLGNGPPLRLDISKLGNLETLYLAEDDIVSSPNLHSSEVEVAIKAVGLGHIDLLAAQGNSKNTEFGAEASGIVLRAGTDTDLHPGDRVAFCGLGVFRTVAKTKVAVKIPDSMSFEEAASVANSFITAYYALKEVARVRQEDKLLMTSAACGLGQACVQVALALGMEVFAGVTNEEERSLIQERYGVPRERIVINKDLGFGNKIHRLTGGRGVDVIINTLDEDGTEASWDCIAPFGRFVEVGPDFKSNERRLHLPEASNISYSTTDLFGVIADRPELTRSLLKEALALFDSGTLRCTSLLRVYPASSITKAFKELLDFGKTVVTLPSTDIVNMQIYTRPVFTFSKDATYVVSGAFGTCGLEIVKWMVERGARHLLLLSRAGGKGASQFVQSLQSQGVQVSAPPCDITDLSSLKYIIGETMRTMPPIKGCIQSAVVVDNVIFAKMSWESWHRVSAPKIQGTWNLHTLLPKDLSFFILLSSMSSCIGFESQAPYSAGNTFLDRLAAHRQSQGQCGVSLGLGPIDIESENYNEESFRDLVYNSGFHLPQSRLELCSLLEYVCAQEKNTKPDFLALHHLVMGIEDPANIRARGREEPTWMQRALFSHFYARASSGRDRDASNDPSSILAKKRSPTELIGQAQNEAEAQEIVTQLLINKVARVLSIREEDVDSKKPMLAYGVDSLVAVEIRNWIAKELGVDVAVFDVMSNTPLSRMGEVISTKCPHRKTS